MNNQGDPWDVPSLEEVKAKLAEMREERRQHENGAAIRAEIARRVRVADVIEAHTPYVDVRGFTACKDNGCVFLGRNVSEHYLHVASMVIAEIGPDDAEDEVCPFDCDSCHGDGCPCERVGCDGDV